MKEPTWSALRWALLAGLFLRLFFAAATPWVEEKTRLGVRGFNDELAHLNHVRHVWREGRLPVQTQSIQSVDAFTHNAFEYYQPPLYYWLAAPFYGLGEMLGGVSVLQVQEIQNGLGSDSSEVALAGGLPGFMVRLFSVLLGLGSVYLAWLLGRSISPKGAVACAWGVALLPTFAFFTSLVTNDVLLWGLSFAFATYLASRQGCLRDQGRPGWRAWRPVFGVGLLLAAALWTKTSALVLLPLLFVRPLWHSVSSRPVSPPGERPWIEALAAGVLAMVLASPWYLRNHLVYGSPLALEVGAGPPQAFLSTLSPESFFHFLSYTLVTFWWHVDPAAGFSLPGKAAILLTTLVWAGAFLHLLCRPGHAPGWNHYVVWLAVLQFVLAGAAYASYNWDHAQTEARLAFVGFPGWLFLTASALESFFGQTRKPKALVHDPNEGT